MSSKLGYMGADVLDKKIYAVGGYDGQRTNLVERYDPTANVWETVTSLSTAK